MFEAVPAVEDRIFLLVGFGGGGGGIDVAIVCVCVCERAQSRYLFFCLYEYRLVMQMVDDVVYFDFDAFSEGCLVDSCKIVLLCVSS